MPFGGLHGKFHIVNRWSTQEISDKFQLLNGTLSLEQDLAFEKFAKDTADTQ